MPDIEVRVVTDPAELPDAELLALYESVGWTAYTRRPDTIRAAVAGSSLVAAAFDGERLVGLVRALSDDATVSYVQDVLVHADFQHRGVGARLMAAVAHRFGHVRQHVLLTDDEPAQRAFYEALDYQEIRDFGPGTLRAFVRFVDPPS